MWQTLKSYVACWSRLVRAALIVATLGGVLGCGETSDREIVWERLEPLVYRTQTPDGWLVTYGSRPVYVPDPEHRWLTGPPTARTPD